MRSSPWATAGVVGALLLLEIGSAPPCDAADTGETPGARGRLERLEREAAAERSRSLELARDARGLAHQVGSVRAEITSVSEAMARQEQQIADLEGQLHVLAATERSLAARFAEKRSRTASVLAAMQRLSRVPPSAILVQPGQPVDTVRAGRVLGRVLEHLRQQSELLWIELTNLADVRRRIGEHRAELAQATARLGAERSRLERLLAESGELETAVAEEGRMAARRAQRLAQEALDLKQLLSGLERERVLAPSLPPPPAAATAKAPVAAARQGGVAALPAGGRIVARYGELMDGGSTSKGITIETAAGSPVVAPATGRVAFAGPFRGYGLLLIVEHGHGYHSLMTGLARIDPVIGQWIVTGEPIGVTDRPADGRPGLYLELRHNGRPIDPLPWLAAGNGKVSG